MISRATNLIFVVISLLAISAAAAQQAHKTQHKPMQPAVMTNDDVVRMVQNQLPESVVLATIQSKPSKFSTSPDDLIRLKKAGATENELNAIVAAATSNGTPSAAAAPVSPPAAASQPGADQSITATPVPAANSAAAPPSGPAPAAAAATPAPTSRMPQVTLTIGDSSQPLPLEKTQLAQTKTKPTSMTSLAADSTMTQALQAGIGTATTSIATHITSGVGSSSMQQAGGILSGVLARRKANVTYVWGVPNPASTNVIATVSPAFAVDFSRVPGIKPDDYQPVIVKLTPAQNTCRIIGATEGKQDATSDPAADWQIYSHFLEERVAAKAEKPAAGKYKLTPASELTPGEYAVVLRPLVKTKGFSGGDVARAQGDGLMFDAVWTFEVSDSAQ